MLIVRNNSEMKDMFTYLRLHKESQANLRKIIKAKLFENCKDFKMKQRRIKNAPDWLNE